MFRVCCVVVTSGVVIHRDDVSEQDEEGKHGDRDTDFDEDFLDVAGLANGAVSGLAAKRVSRI